jgi:hypothetical protein
MVTRPKEHPFSAKQEGPFASRSRSKHARRPTIIFPNGVEHPVHTSFPGRGASGNLRAVQLLLGSHTKIESKRPRQHRT